MVRRKICPGKKTSSNKSRVKTHLGGDFAFNNKCSILRYEAVDERIILSAVMIYDQSESR